MKRADRNKSKSQSQDSHSDPHQSEADHYERHIDGSINVRGEIETKRPPDLTQEHATERKQDNAREKNKFVVEIVTLIVVAIYAALTAWQGCMTRESITNNTRQFQIDQRPWINPEILPQRIDTGVVIQTTLRCPNSGKTPAREAAGEFIMKLVKSGQVPVLDYASNRARFILGVIYPNSPCEATFEMLNQDMTKHVTTEEEASQFKAGQLFLVTYGKIAYSDFTGSKYEQHFCAWSAQPGHSYAAKNCTEYNSIDNNK